MEGLVAGDVVVVPFPFTDLTSQKVRPALVAASLDRGDVLLCQITSKPYSHRHVIRVLTKRISSLVGCTGRVTFCRIGL
jgi:mRNA interferase MazF